MHGHHGRGWRGHNGHEGRHHHWREAAIAWIAANRGGWPGGEDGSESRGPGGPGSRGWGRGGGRLLGHGDLRLLLLALIAEQPRHGYDLIKAVEERFAGAYAPSPGAVYPLLTMLEEQDLIAATQEGTKKLYSVTPEGEAFLKDNDAQVQGILTRIDIAAAHHSSRTAPESVWEAWKTLKSAMNMPRGPWTEAEAERIRAILEAAARDIVRGPGK